MVLNCFIFVTPLTDLKQTVHFIPQGWPVSGQLSSRFGMRYHPIKHKKIFHKGVDIAQSIFSKVRATAPGKIKSSGFKKDYGKYVLVDHGHGWETLYAHLQSVQVRKGNFVARWAILGRVGQTGLSTGPHLHYEVLYQGVPQDPLHFINESDRRDSLQLADSYQTLFAPPD